MLHVTFEKQYNKHVKTTVGYTYFSNFFYFFFSKEIETLYV